MHLALNGKRAVVCGATSGVGLAIAIGLAGAGVEVVLNGRSQAAVDAALRAVREQLPKARIIGIALDLVTEGGAWALIERVPHTDILVDTLGVGDALWRHYAVGMAERCWGQVILPADSALPALAEVAVHGVPMGSPAEVAAQVVLLASSAQPG